MKGYILFCKYDKGKIAVINSLSSYHKFIYSNSQSMHRPGWERHMITLACICTCHIKTTNVLHGKHCMVCCFFSLIQDLFIFCTPKYTFFYCTHSIQCLSIFHFLITFLLLYNYFQFVPYL